MQKLKVDYIIIGQGIAGTWLSHELIKRNKSVLVINKSSENTSSRKAAGLYNPITGRKMVNTWRADDFFGSLENDYRQLESLLNARFLHPKPIYRPFRSAEDQNDWQGKNVEESSNKYVSELTTWSLAIKDINDPFGGILLNTSGYVDLPRLLDAYKKFLIDKGIYREEVFDSSEMKETSDGVQYKNYSAQKILLCEGSSDSVLCGDLPFKPVRGEIIDITCDLDTDKIINQGVWMIPKDGYFSVGSTYDHKVLTYEPQQDGVTNIKDRLSKIFSGEYRVIDKRAGVRPATYDRKPFIGFHKNFRTVGIFNGFGTKGVSLSPYFAKHYADVLEQKDELEKEVSVERTY